ncbi:MAG: hypothetical protein NTV54_01045 [Ignavibacteriales bacterium]|nr:hypothetical protein [Ignavibacteriales bacterium]
MTIHQHHQHSLLFLLVALGLFVYSCKDSSNPITKPGDVVFPATNISYYRHVQPLFNIACATTNCHDRATRQSNVDLSSYAGIRGRFYDIVIPKDTLNSRLIWCIEGRPGSSPMPPPPIPSLDLNQVKGIKRWIYEGATDTIP